MTEHDMRPTDREREEISQQIGQLAVDPAPSATDAAQDKLEAYVSGLTTTALDELRRFRDDTDALMVALQGQHKLLIQAIDEHAVKVTAVLQSKIIMAEQTQNLRSLFAPMTPVLTQLNGRQK